MRAEDEQKPSGAVERASYNDARPTEQTAHTLSRINAQSIFNTREGEEKGGQEGKTPVFPSWQTERMGFFNLFSVKKVISQIFQSEQITLKNLFGKRVIFPLTQKSLR